MSLFALEVLLTYNMLIPGAHHSDWIFIHISKLMTMVNLVTIYHHTDITLLMTIFPTLYISSDEKEYICATESLCLTLETNTTL